MIKIHYTLKALMNHAIDFGVLNLRKGPLLWSNLANITSSCEQHCITNNNGISDSMDPHLIYEEKKKNTRKVILRKLRYFKHSRYIR